MGSVGIYHNLDRASQCSSVQILLISPSVGTRLRGAVHGW